MSSGGGPSRGRGRGSRLASPHIDPELELGTKPDMTSLQFIHWFHFLSRVIIVFFLFWVLMHNNNDFGLFAMPF